VRIPSYEISPETLPFLTLRSSRYTANFSSFSQETNIFWGPYNFLDLILGRLAKKNLNLTVRFSRYKRKCKSEVNSLPVNQIASNFAQRCLIGIEIKLHTTIFKFIIFFHFLNFFRNFRFLRLNCSGTLRSKILKFRILSFGHKIYKMAKTVFWNLQFENFENFKISKNLTILLSLDMNNSMKL